MFFILVAKSSCSVANDVCCKPKSSNDDGSMSSLKNILVVGRAKITLLELLVDAFDDGNWPSGKNGLTNAIAVRPLLLAKPTDTAINAIVPFIVGVESGENQTWFIVEPKI